MGGQLGLPPHVIADYTLREIQCFAAGAARKNRADMATLLWAVYEGAAFNAYAFAGKRAPSIKKRLDTIMSGKSGKPGERAQISEMVHAMNRVAAKASMPAPKSTRHILKE